MPVRLGFSVGESFAEAIGPAGDDSTFLAPHRWHLPRKSLTDGIRDWLGESASDGGEIRIVSSLAGFALHKNLGTKPSFLVTTGFESWLSVNSPVIEGSRGALPLSDDLTFGISERLRADGSVETPLNLDDLQFLAAKLEMLKTKAIAVGLLHSDVNPIHEVQIRDYFKERGYTVFCSHEQTPDNAMVGCHERDRWLRAAFDAYASNALQDQKIEFEEALGEHKEKWTLQFVTASDANGPLHRGLGYRSSFGDAEALGTVYGQKAPVLHLGLEQFLLIESERGGVPDRDPRVPTYCGLRHRRLGVQPSSPIESGFWPAPTVGPAPRGFEPGPMAFGKAQHPTVFDVVFALERLDAIDGLNLQEKSRSRALESLFTLAKSIAKVPDPKAIAKDLETLIIERMNEDLLILGKRTEIIVTGALAKAFLPLLEARRPDIRFRLAPQAEWAEAIAARELPNEARA